MSASGSGERWGRAFSVLLSTKKEVQKELPPVVGAAAKLISLKAHVPPNLL